jgi:serine/threonine-protein kinase
MPGDIRKLCVVCAKVYREDLAMCPDDGAMLVVEAGGGTANRLGHVFGNYRLQRVIGEGGVGTVYEGVHVGLGRKRAIKLLREDATEELVTRFFNEARAVNEIRHPNIVDIEDFVSTETGDHYLVMELLAGEDLRATLRRERVLAPERVLALGEQIAGALAAVHAVGIVHRDLKPENLFVNHANGSDAFKLVDFGIAKFLADDKGMTRAGMTLGTPEYMAPEQILTDGQPGPATDVYALGMVMYECLAGAPAFTGATAAVLRGHISETVVPPSLARGEAISPVLEAVVLKCLAKDAAARFASAEEVREALRADAPVAVPADVPAAVPARAATAPPVRARAPRSRVVQMIPAFAMAAAAAVLHFAPSSRAAAATHPGPRAPSAHATVPAVAPAPAPLPTPAPAPLPAPAPVAPAPTELSLQLESDPPGAELFVGAARTAIGRAPATATLAMSSDPIKLIAHFPDGVEVVQSVVPDRALPAVHFIEPKIAAPLPARPPVRHAPADHKTDREGTIDPFQ